MPGHAFRWIKTWITDGQRQWHPQKGIPKLHAWTQTDTQNTPTIKRNGIYRWVRLGWFFFWLSGFYKHKLFLCSAVEVFSPSANRQILCTSFSCFKDFFVVVHSVLSQYFKEVPTNYLAPYISLFRIRELLNSKMKQNQSVHQWKSFDFFSFSLLIKNR